MSLGPVAPLKTPKVAKPVVTFDAAERAKSDATLEEGRKKFFEQSTGFDNSQYFGTGIPSGQGGASKPGLPGPALQF